MILLRKLRYRIQSFIKFIRTLYYTWRTKRVVKSYGEGLLVNNKCHFTRNTILGANCNFNGLHINGGGAARIVIGDNFHSGQDCKIIARYHNYEGEFIPYDATFIDKDVIIGDQVWLGDNVIILGGVTIGEGAIIQAGAVVVSDISPCAVAGGSPAKVFKYRNREHYEDLKSKKRFF